MKYLACVLLLISSHVKAIEIGFLTADTNQIIGMAIDYGDYETSVRDFHYGVEYEDWRFLHDIVGITFEVGYPNLVIYDGRDMSELPEEYHRDACRIMAWYPVDAYSYTALKSCPADIYG